MTATVALGLWPNQEYVPPCTSDPERWTTAVDVAQPDEEATALCRACHRRWLCAREAWETPGVEGIWAGVVIPESGRPRQFALRKLRSLAELGGYEVRPHLRHRRFVTGSP